MIIIQISDTHLSHLKQHFVDNWAPVHDWIRGMAPDLVVHTGDVTVDGAGISAEFGYAQELFDGLGIPVLCLPGNHDVGDAQDPGRPVNLERIQEWKKVFRSDCWYRDIPNWRLIGLDGQILEGEESLSEEAFEWLEQCLEQRGSRQIILFTHKPLFVEKPDEQDGGYWSLSFKVRTRLLTLLSKHSVVLISSGHLHRAWQGRVNGIDYLWCPSTAFMVEKLDRSLPGRARFGAAVIHLDGQHYSVEIVDVPGLTPHYIDSVIDEVYPGDAELKESYQ